MKHDIGTIEDIKTLVNNFYNSVQADALLAPVFEARIQGRWATHLEKMYRFWSTVLLSGRSYFGSPFPPHLSMHLQEQHFENWLALFNHTIDTYFAGPKAEEAKWRAAKMAAMFWSKISYYRATGAQPLV